MLQNVTLGNLSDGKLEAEFQAALLKIQEAWDEGREGPCTVSVKIKMDKKPGVPFVDLTATVSTHTPDRSQSSVLMLKDGRLKVETTSDDAREPGLEFPEESSPAAQTIRLGGANA